MPEEAGGSFTLINIFSNRSLFDYCDVSLSNYSPENGQKLLNYYSSSYLPSGVVNTTSIKWVGFLGRYSGSNAEDIVTACGSSMSPLSAKLISPGQTVLDISLGAYLQNMGMAGFVDWSDFNGPTWYKYQNIKGVRKGPPVVSITQDIGDATLGPQGHFLNIFAGYVSYGDGSTVNDVLSSAASPLIITIDRFTENPLDIAEGPASAFNVLYYLTYLLNLGIISFSCIVLRNVFVSLDRRIKMDYKYATSLCCAFSSLMKVPLLNPFGFNNDLSQEPVSVVLTHEFLYLALSLIGNIFSFCFLMDFFRTVEDAMSFKIVSRKFRRTSIAIALTTGIVFVSYVGYSWGSNFNRIIKASYQYNFHYSILSVVLGLLLLVLIGRVFVTIKKVVARVHGEAKTVGTGALLTTAAKTMHTAAAISRTVSLTERNAALNAQRVGSSIGTGTPSATGSAIPAKNNYPNVTATSPGGVSNAQTNINDKFKVARQELYVKVVARLVHSCQYMVAIAILLIVNGVLNMFKYLNQDCEGYVALIIIRLGIPFSSSIISFCDLMIVYKASSVAVKEEGPSTDPIQNNQKQ